MLPVMRTGETSESDDPSRANDDGQQLAAVSVVEDTLVRLNKLGVTIRQSSRGRIDVKVQRFAASLELRSFAAASQAVVQQLYPNAHQSLQQYLGKTMVDRYSAILFARHRERQLQSRRPKNAFGSMPTIDEFEDVPGQHPPGPVNIGHQMVPKTSSSGALTGTLAAASQFGVSTVNSKQLRLVLRRTNNFQLPTAIRKGTSSIQVGQGNYPRSPFQRESNSITCEWCSKIIEKRDMDDSDWRCVSFLLNPFKIWLR